MGSDNIEDQGTALQKDELVALKNVESTVVSDAELQEIEAHLRKLYITILVKLYDDSKTKRGFDKFVKRPLYVAALHFCNNNKKKVAKLLGVSRVILRNTAAFCYGNTNINNFTESDHMLLMFYKNYLGQILTDGVSDKFAIIVDRAMYRAVMEFAKDDLTLASKLLGVTKPVLTAGLDKYFGTRRLLELG